MRGGPVVVAVLGFALYAPPASAQESCLQEGEVTIARNSVAHVVGKPTRGGYFTTAWACRGGGTRRIEIEGCDCVDINSLKLRGLFVAYDMTDDPGEEYGRDLIVRDLREETSPEPGTSPGRLVDSQDVSVDFPQSPEGPFLGRYGLRPNGTVAFTVWHGGRWRVAMCRYGCRAPTVLDGHRGIDPSWLKISRDRVRWRRRGVVRSGTLP